MKYNKYKTTNSSAFIEVVNKVTGEDYGWFFNQYLYNNKVPFLEFYQSKEGVLYYRWTDVADNFNQLPISVTFESDTMSSWKSFHKIYPNKKVQLFKNPDKNNLISKVKVWDYWGLFGIKKNKRLDAIYKKEQSL